MWRWAGTGGGPQHSPQGTLLGGPPQVLLASGLSSCWCWQELEQRQEAQCSKVEQAGEDPHSYYFPGQFAFSKALPPS